MFIASITSIQQSQAQKQNFCNKILKPAATLAATGSVLVMANGVNKGHMTHMSILERGLTNNNKYFKNVLQFGAKNIKLGAIGFGVSLLTGYIANKFCKN